MLWMEDSFSGTFHPGSWMTPTVVKMTMYLLFMSLIVSFYGPSSLHNFPLIQTAVIALGFSRCETDVLRVIGGNVTVVQGDTVILPCKLTDTTETIDMISWQRDTRGKHQDNRLFTIQQDGSAEFFNGADNQFKFIGSIEDKNGSLQLSNVTLLDEGIYRCIFTLFPSGNHKTEMHLNVLVPPVISVTDNQPILGNEEVSLATCTAAGSKPPAEIKWVTDAVTEKVKVQTNSTEEADGTTTTVSLLIGVPTREINHTVQCVVTSPALSKQETLTFIIQVYFSPTEVNFLERSKDTFECVSEANPEANFTWSRSAQSLPQSSVRVEGAMIQLLNFTSDLNGLYQCDASNPYGRKHGQLYLHVTSEGTCTVYWMIFGNLLCTVTGAAAAVWCLHKKGPRDQCDIHGHKIISSCTIIYRLQSFLTQMVSEHMTCKK
ncbi:nectin-4-like isoform X1 [Mastacembelus armatus]|uniref:nectin-4-like isoform X1 n=1 Tax=Mastacembelus armatus TaxID=205130 RepID=UPI000E45A3C4|nr:nectin-4-like isoform X1 [Mastacembelus armatus]